MDGAAQLLGYDIKLDLHGASSIKFSKRSQKRILQLSVNYMNIGLFVHEKNRKSVFVCDIDRCVSSHEEFDTKTVFVFSAITKLDLQSAVDGSDVYFQPAKEDTGYFVCTGFDILQQVGIPPSLQNVSNCSTDMLRVVDIKHLNRAGLKFLREIRVFKEKKLPLIDLCKDDPSITFSECEISESDSSGSLSVSYSESLLLNLTKLKFVDSSAVIDKEISPAAVLGARKKRIFKRRNSTNIKKQKRKSSCIDGSGGIAVKNKKRRKLNGKSSCINAPDSTIIRNRKRRKLNGKSSCINGPASTIIRSRKRRKLNGKSSCINAPDSTIVRNRKRRKLNGKLSCINGPASTIIRNRKRRKLCGESPCINGPASTIIRNRKRRKLNRQKKEKSNWSKFIDSDDNFLKNNPEALADAVEFLKYPDPDEYFPDDAVGVYVSIFGEFWVKFRLFAESSKELKQNEKPKHLKDTSLDRVKDKDGSQYSDLLKEEIIDFIIMYHISIA